MALLKLNYAQTRKLILSELKGKKISTFCRANSISYQQFMNFKSNANKQYPTLLKKILKGLGYGIIKVEKIIIYNFNDKPNSNEN